MQSFLHTGLITVFLIVSCAGQKTNTIDTSTAPDTQLILFSYPMFPDKEFVILEEHNDLDIATRILSSYNNDDLINALSLGYLTLPASEQTYVTTAFQNSDTLPRRFQESLVIAVVSGHEDHQDPTLNALKNLLIASYGQMGQDEIQSRYFYGLSATEQYIFRARWNIYANWYNQQLELQRQQQREAQYKDDNSPGFWGVLGQIVVAVIGGYASYKASTYNSNVANQVSDIQMQNTQMQWQINSIQSDLRRLAY